jgi:hypothetical protein
MESSDDEEEDSKSEEGSPSPSRYDDDLEKKKDLGERAMNIY